MEEKLKDMKRTSPKSIPYAFCWLELHPGYATLKFITHVRVKSHNIGISPKGFSWNDAVYPSVDSLTNAFKKNPHGPKPKAVAKPPAPQPPRENVNRSTGTNSSEWGQNQMDPRNTGTAPQGNWSRPAPPPPIAPPVPMQPPPIDAWQNPGGWNNGRPAPPPRPPAGPPPPSFPPPPTYNRPPPPPGQRPPQPLPPSGPQMQRPPTQGFGSAPQSQGRGRGRTIPAWMSKGSS